MHSTELYEQKLKRIWSRRRKVNADMKIINIWDFFSIFFGIDAKIIIKRNAIAYRQPTRIKYASSCFDGVCGFFCHAKFTEFMSQLGILSFLGIYPTVYLS